MKTLRLPLIALAGCLGMLSCSDDDSDTNDTNSEISGTYNLTMVLAPTEVDSDGNGTPHSDLMLESPCYADSHIMINEDGTYMSEYSYAFFESETGCTAETQEGSWEADDDHLMLTNESFWPTPAPVSYIREDNTLIITLEDVPYPDRDGDNNPIYTTGDLTLTYTKVE